MYFLLLYILLKYYDVNFKVKFNGYEINYCLSGIHNSSNSLGTQEISSQKTKKNNSFIM